MQSSPDVLAPGARVLIRDAEWLVRSVDRSSERGHALSVVGLSELVRDKEAVFLTHLERDVEVLDPAETELVADTSSAYRASRLYMESLLRQTPPTDEHLYVGHRAAMDTVPYQLDPAIQALEQPRQRILIADAVGLGKTLEAGVLLSELIKRGRGKRILVVAVKSMLTQFQKELWSRFTIPLVRLDSVGIQRIRSRIPTNHNPFYYYDKAIVSVDTLKQDGEYRTYLENAYWDVIVIDEAHNVAERGSNSLRSRLAKLLATRSDTLIMLSATPHDGKARSFASLMNMLNPTAIANPEDYTREDIQGLFIRRFKKDIQDQVVRSFKERRIAKAHSEASALEEAAFEELAAMTFTRLDGRRSGSMLFKTTLEKALLSSPAACLQTIRNRTRRLEQKPEGYEEDIKALERLATRLEKITPEHFSKYQKLLGVIQDPDHGFGWTPDDTENRLVVFTERIETLKFLEEHLKRDLKLKDEQVEILHGGLPDVDQQRIVEDFGRDEAPVRLLLASDVASEGINLHYLSHRMIHFDVPWSLMVFQQRNGRIDRYGQERTPEIVYLMTDSASEKIKGDTRILELLIEKDEQAVKNIGDPSALMGVYDIEEEEQKTAEAIEAGQSAEEFDGSLQEEPDLLAMLMEGPPPSGEAAENRTRRMPSLFASDFDYLRAALEHVRAEQAERGGQPLQVAFDPTRQRVELTAQDELKDRFDTLPNEVWPEDGAFVLSADVDAVQREIRRCRKDEKAWPRIHYLWEQHPVVRWVNDKVVASFRRHEAPALVLPDALDPGEVVFVVSGLIPNRKGHPLVHRWFGVVFRDGNFENVEPIERVFERTGLADRAVPNRGEDVDSERLQALLPDAVEMARVWMSEQRDAFNAKIRPKLDDQLEALQRLRKKQYDQLELDFESKREQLREDTYRDRVARGRRKIDRTFDEYRTWIRETMETEDNPYLQVVAVLQGESK